MANNDINQQFSSVVDTILRETWEFYPNLASGLGLHEYDGRLTDISGAALSRRARDLEQGLESLGRIDASRLTRQNLFDHRLLISSLRKELFELTDLRTYETNPMDTLWHIELSGYIKRDYAPLEQRIVSLTSALEGVPSFLNDLRGILSRRLGEPVLEASIEAYEGIVNFYDNDLQQAVDALANGPVKRRFERARGEASLAVIGFIQYLKALQRDATDDFAIGPDRFQALLKYGEMVEAPLDRLLRVGLEDMARNQARFRQAASRMDSKKSPAEVMKELAKDHPKASSLIGEARDMLESIRQFLIDRDIVSVPSEARCQTVETPSFMRWAFAAMDIPGPFETQAREAYYYITPVEERWTDEQKEEWLTSFNYGVLQATSIHEAYPGHYVHYLHTQGAPSKISLIFGAYSFWEGWAHYTEEMMIEEGYAGDDPRIVIGQLSDALLRNCRFICAIRMHTEGMTLDEATRFFMENAYMEELPARTEARRGTFDPMYLSYTLGKLMILKLREDYRYEKGDAFSLKEFHDTLLSFGAPPIPLVREMMLRNPGRDVL